jgi:GNAT superfamily N-acetyltransferase
LRQELLLTYATEQSLIEGRNVAHSDVIPIRCNQQHRHSNITMAQPIYEWKRTIDGQQFIISNRLDWHSHDFIQKAFDSDEVYWTHSIHPQSLETMLANSCTLGLYAVGTPVTSDSEDITQGSGLKQLGFGRLVTDYVTIAFLTDVYIVPELQGKGLGKWLIQCAREIMDSMPELRRSILMTDAKGKGVKFYAEELDMKVFNSGDEGRVVMMHVPGHSKP